MSTELKMMAFKISDVDRTRLERISEHFSDASFSAILRRLIREEAHRIGVNGQQDDDDESAPVLAGQVEAEQ